MQPYVFIQSEDGTRDKTLLQLTGEIIHCDKMADIPRVSDAASSLTYDTVSMLPFSTIKERCSKGSNLYETVNEGEKIITMKIKEQKIITEDEFRTKFTPEDVQMDGEMEYDRTKEEYCEIIRRIIEDEISNGEGSSFVTPRKCMGKITAFSDTSALSIFNRLILHEYGCYWKFLFFDGTQYFIGASPERHLEVRNNKAFMNPISGTFRKDHSVSAEQNTTELIKFLGNQKETNELFMVTDEELKMMSTMCGAGGRIIGPLLKEMAHLVHTEYLLEGTPSPGEDIISLLRKSMYAPTVIGSPVGNACKVVAKYEQRSRSYYSSAIVLIGRDANDSLDEFLDSSITIRTLEIKPTGDFSIRVGATLVKDSIPTEEYEECNAKIRGAVSALKTPKPYTTLSCSENELVQSALLRRNKNTSRFWMDNQVDCSDQNLRGKKIVMSNNEDDFIFMLRHILERMGCEVTVFNFFELSSEAAQKAIEEADCCVVGPGPGDPTDTSRPDNKMGKVRSYVTSLLDTKKPFLAVCLGHQVLSHYLGFEIIHKDIPTQGVQKDVSLYGDQQLVGFYNAFYAKYNEQIAAKSGIVDCAIDGEDMLSTQGDHWISFQFHPESILTVNGYTIVRDALMKLLK